MHKANCLQSIVVNCRRKESMLLKTCRENANACMKSAMNDASRAGRHVGSMHMHNCNADNGSVTIAV